MAEAGQNQNTTEGEFITTEFDFSEMLIHVMLPLLLFAGALTINVKEFLKEKVTILSLSLIHI